ncbi:GBP4 protein, partial [Anseranas semipalmata]|nr:GBP4 protein [Anseranas semipalmata]
EHRRQLEERLWREQRALLDEQSRAIEHKLQEQRALLQEGFRQQAEALQAQIAQLREERERTEKPSWRHTALDVLSTVASLFLPG